MTATDCNINSASFRLDARPAPVAPELRIARLERSLAELKDAGMENFGGYKLLVEMLATAKASAE